MKVRINEISKAIMARISRRYCFWENRSDKNRGLFSKQRNLCVSLQRNSKKDYFKKVIEKIITDNRHTWKKVGLFCQIKFNLLIELISWKKKVI